MMIRHTILSFTHEKIFRHDKSCEPNKFTKFLYAILMPIQYIINHNTSLRYDWNRDIYVINKMEFTGKFLEMTYRQYTKLDEPKDHEYDKISYMQQPGGARIGSRNIPPINVNKLRFHDSTQKDFFINKKKAESRDKKLTEPDGLICPFCNDDDFDLQGLHDHIALYCDEFDKIETDTRTLGSMMYQNSINQKKETQMKINLEIAKICFEANKQFCIKNKLPFAAQTFDEQTDEYKEGIVAGVAQVIADPKITAAESHANWLKSKKADGWKLGKVVDYNKKLHPNMVPFDKLPKVEQEKDKLFITTILEEMKR